MYLKTAIWYEAKYYENRDNVPDTEIEETEGYSYIRHDDIDVSSAKYKISGVEISKSTRVIETKGDIEYKKGDRIEINGKIHYVEEVKRKLPDDKKNAVFMWPGVELINTIFTLYLK